MYVKAILMEFIFGMYVCMYVCMCVCAEDNYIIEYFMDEKDKCIQSYDWGHIG